MHQSTRPRSQALRVTMLFTATIAATYGFGVYLFASLVPDMREGLGLGYGALGSVAAVRQAAFLAMALTSPVAVLRLGGGRVILLSLLVCGAALCGLAATHSAWVAGGLLIVLNACAASAWVPMVALVAKAVAFEHRGKAIGLIASGTNYGLCANGILVPLLLPGFGWRSVWLASGGLTLVLCLCLLWTLRDAALLTDGEPAQRRGGSMWRLAVASRYGIVYALAGLGGLAGVPFATYVSARIRDDLQLSVTASGEAWLAMGVFGAVGGLILGTLGDKVGLRSALTVAATVLSASGLVVATTRSPTAMAIAAGGFGASFFSIFGLLPAYVGKTAEAKATPVICGLAECALGLGGSAGSALGGFSPEWTGSFRAIFVCTAVLGLVMLVVTQFLPSELVDRAGPHDKRH